MIYIIFSIYGDQTKATYRCCYDNTKAKVIENEESVSSVFDRPSGRGSLDFDHSVCLGVQRGRKITKSLINNKMKVLLFGDSLTKGQVGANFVKLLARDYPDSKFVNRGTNGDTLNMISQKLIRHMEKEKDYDLLILQGGGNDILLPSFKAKGGLFKFAYNQQIKKGLVPSRNPSDFYDTLKQTVSQLKQLYAGKIIFLTLSCLNEKLDTALNHQRREYNKVIRRVVAEEEIFLADIEAPFDAFLKDKIQTDYLIERFWAVTVTDRIVSLFRGGPGLLSKKRKLYLTVDGAHINESGGKIIRDVIRKIVEKEK